jgi:hypothetical protein
MRLMISLAVTAALVTATIPAFAQASGVYPRYDVGGVGGRDAILVNQHRRHPRVYGQRREGYVPDRHLCFPGACQDNPYY